MSEIENIEDISDKEKQKIYTHFCQLVTILHDYAVGKKLYSEKLFSWAITANYYSLMHCGRFICTLGGIEYPNRHSDLISLLSGRHTSEKYQNLLNSINGYIPNHDSPSKITTLGEKLKLIKKIRECNSYELFIIAHQHNHDKLENIFNDCYSEVDSINLEYIEFCLDLLVEYINRSPSKEFYVAFLTEERGNYGSPVDSFINESVYVQGIQLEIMQIIKQLINEKLNFKTDMILPDSFFDAINFHNFESKSNKMEKFQNYVNDLKRLRRHESA